MVALLSRAAVPGEDELHNWSLSTILQGDISKQTVIAKA
jgi:hypothetical protein